MKAKLPLGRDYVEFVTGLKQRIVSARLHAARAVNRDLILLYWDIGKGIVEKQGAMGWGDSVVEALADDLQRAFPGTSGTCVGFTPRTPIPKFCGKLSQKLAN
jgi:hypothetical protein